MDATDGRRARGDARREEILDAATQIVAEGGSPALTHRSVAAALNTSPTTVIYHFKTMAELRRATFQHAGSVIGEYFYCLLTDRLTTAFFADPIEPIADSVATMVADKRSETVAVLEMIVACSREPELRPILDDLYDHLRDVIGPVLPTSDPNGAIAAVQGAILTGLATAPAHADAPSRVAALVHTALEPLFATHD